MRIKLVAEEIEREKAKLPSLMQQGEVLHGQGLKHPQKTISLCYFLSSMRGKAVDLSSQCSILMFPAKSWGYGTL